MTDSELRRAAQAIVDETVEIIEHVYDDDPRPKYEGFPRYVSLGLNISRERLDELKAALHAPLAESPAAELDKLITHAEKVASCIYISTPAEEGADDVYEVIHQMSALLRSQAAEIERLKKKAWDWADKWEETVDERDDAREEIARLKAKEPLHDSHGESPAFEINNDEVICPRCIHQFRAIPINVQKELERLRMKEPPHCPTCSCGGPEFETVPKADFDALLDECRQLREQTDQPTYISDVRLACNLEHTTEEQLRKRIAILEADRDRLQAIINKLDRDDYADTGLQAWFDTCIAPAQSTKGSG